MACRGHWDRQSNLIVVRWVSWCWKIDITLENKSKQRCLWHEKHCITYFNEENDSIKISSRKHSTSYIYISIYKINKWTNAKVEPFRFRRELMKLQHIVKKNQEMKWNWAKGETTTRERVKFLNRNSSVWNLFKFVASTLGADKRKIALSPVSLVEWIKRWSKPKYTRLTCTIFAENDNYWFWRHNIPLALIGRAWNGCFKRGSQSKFNAVNILYFRLVLNESVLKTYIQREREGVTKVKCQREKKYTHTQRKRERGKFTLTNDFLPVWLHSQLKNGWRMR